MAFDGMSGMTVRQLWEERVQLFPDKEFLIFRSRAGSELRFTYAEYDRHINRVANFFLDLGVQKGDTVAVHLCNSVEFMACLFGLAKIGGIMVPINEQNLQRESEYVLERIMPRAVVTEEAFLPMYQAIQEQRPELVEHLLMARTDEEVPGTRNLRREVMLRDPVLRERRDLLDTDTVQVMYTSGTTSIPKGVEMTHANLVFAGQYTQWQVSLRDDDIFLTTMPACHSNFQLAAMMPVIWTGATLVMTEKYSASRFMDQVREYGATVVQMVAMMVHTLMLQPERSNDAEHKLREVMYFLNIDTAEKEAFERRYGVRLMNSYGSTESIGWVITDYPSGKRKWPSVGRVGLGYQVKIADDRGYEQPTGVMGEILIRGQIGRSVMKGYYRDELNTRRTIDSNGWMHTGDKAYMDEEGFIFFVDRKSNMIKRAGENISTTEIEEVLMHDDRISEAAVIGVPDPIRDQAVKAFVVPSEGVELSEADVIALCERELAAFKVPSYVEIRTSLPHTTSMKVEKKLLS